MTTDMSSVIVAKSDQLNSDDLMGSPRTITITDVSIRPGTEQPVTISYDGDGGKPWKPCKTAARILVAAWGADAKKYIGRSVTLYRDPAVKWGGLEVGGIRPSHLSHIDGKMVLAVTMTKGNKKPVTILPLIANHKPDATPLIERVNAAATMDELVAVWTAIGADFKRLDKADQDRLTRAKDVRKSDLITPEPGSEG